MSHEHVALAEAERRHHNEEAEQYALRIERAHIFHLPEEKLFWPLLEEGMRSRRVILDVGCGPAISVGKHLEPILGPHDVYIGVDIAERMLDIARRNVRRGLFVRHDVGQLRLRPASADVVLSLGCLHHLPDPMPVVDELIGALRPGGLMLLREPTDRAFRRGEGESPAEAGLDMNVLRQRLLCQGCTILAETYLTSWVFIKARHYLERAHLQVWERLIWPWRFKLAAELRMHHWAGDRLPRLLRGLDAYVVARRGAAAGHAAEHERPSTSEATLAEVLSCPRCGGQLAAASTELSCSDCRMPLVVASGIWSFEGNARDG